MGEKAMMGKRKKRNQTPLIKISEMIPEKHQLKKIARAIDFDFIYEKAAPYYSGKGRPSIDPVTILDP